MILSDLYILPFIRVFTLAISLGFLLVFILNYPGKWKFIWPWRLGGLALVIPFLFAVLWNRYLVIDRTLMSIVGAVAVVLVFGMMDDRFRFSWRVQLFFQISIAVALFFGGVAVQNIGLPMSGAWFLHPELSWWPSLPLTVAWLLLVVNAVNWSDGSDGVAGSTALVGFLTIFILSLRPEVNQPPTAILAIAAAGATFGFLVFNFPPARFIAGTAGSYFWGFLLGALAIFAGTKIATTMLVLAVPLLDALWVVIDRWRSGTSIFQGDRERHLHYRLRRLGWSDRQIAMAYMSMAVAAGMAALTLGSTGKIVSFLMIVVIFSFIFISIKDQETETV